MTATDMDRLLEDFVEGSAEEIARYPMYLTLNLSRVLAYREEGLVLSKKEGGEWALDRLPAVCRPLIRDALREYTESAEIVYDEALARAYAEYILRRIEGKERTQKDAARKGAEPWKRNG